ncbi:WXG100 family type VII secretion target [Streptomyces sp. NPDC004111]|uniref:WXG100 family type VII secretion target n=1 Tax=Streptomyces sp. NPDC004111 TaxID=3364690 RepID=UPI00369BD0B5
MVGTLMGRYAVNPPPNGPGSAGAAADLAVNGDKLRKLAEDLDAMQEALTNQLLRMDKIVDDIEARWRGPASEEYRTKHRAAAKHAVRIRRTMNLLAKAVRLSKDGFSADELDVLEEFRRIQSGIDIQAETDVLSTPNTAPAPKAVPHSRIGDL